MEIGIGALIAVCAIMIIKPILDKFFPSAGVKFKKYYPYAIMAFKYVEEHVDDNVGTDSKDPIAARYLHKVDLFCEQFIKYSEKFSGSKPSKAMIEEAKSLATYLAKQETK
jgi:hypothetical protein